MSTRVTRASLKSDMEDFKTNLVAAYQDPAVEESLLRIFMKATRKTDDAIAEMQRTLVTLHKDLKARDEKIAHLTEENKVLKEQIDDLEQYSRKPSIRVYGVSEQTAGSTDQKLLELFNNVLKITPPIQPDEIEVSHRIGKQQAPAAEGSGDNGSNEITTDTAPIPPSRTIIARFTSRKVKTRVMEAKKELRTALEDQDEDAPPHFPGKVFIADDLTPLRARLSYKARVLARQNKIASTWVFDGRVLYKDHHNRIHQIRSEEDLPQ